MNDKVKVCMTIISTLSKEEKMELVKMASQDNWLTIDEVCQMLCVSRKFVCSLISRKKLKATKLSGKCVRIALSDVLSMMEDRK